MLLTSLARSDLLFVLNMWVGLWGRPWSFVHFSQNGTWRSAALRLKDLPHHLHTTVSENKNEHSEISARVLPFIGIIYIHVFKEAIFGHCLKCTGFRGQNFKGKVFFLTKNPPLHKHIQCRYLWVRHNFVCCILMYAKGIKELPKSHDINQWK